MRSPHPTSEYRPRRPWSTDSSRNDARAFPRRRRYAASGVRRSVLSSVTVTSLVTGPTTKNDPLGVVGRAVRAVGAFAYALRLPPRSWRHAHQVGVGNVISCRVGEPA